jgi:hypothetical protein
MMLDARKKKSSRRRKRNLTNIHFCKAEGGLTGESKVKLVKRISIIERKRPGGGGRNRSLFVYILPIKTHSVSSGGPERSIGTFGIPRSDKLRCLSVGGGVSVGDLNVGRGDFFWESFDPLLPKKEESPSSVLAIE